MERYGFFAMPLLSSFMSLILNFVKNTNPLMYFLTMNRFLSVIFVTILVPFALSAQIGELPRSSPEEQGVSSAKVMAFLDSITSLSSTEIHGVVLMRHGHIIAEKYSRPFAAEYGHTLFSCSKTFTSAAIGIAIAENRLRLDDRLAAFFPEYLPDTIDGRLASITIRDLLTMTSGFRPTNYVRNNETQWIRTYLANEIVAEPGKRFAYDSMGTYLLSAIIQRVTGQTLLDYLRPRLFEPLHIEHLNWEWSPEGVTCGGWALYMQAESMAKFGLLLLNKGEWNGRQLIPSRWVEAMMYPHVKRDDGDAYCYQMWECPHPNTARADGAFGQYIIVMPDENAVLVVTQCQHGDAPQREMQWLFEMLVPTFSDEPLIIGKDTQRLADKDYSLPYAEGKAKTKSIREINGKRYMLGENRLGWKSVMVDQTGKELSLIVETTDGMQNSIRCGYHSWCYSKVDVNFAPHPWVETKGTYSGFTEPFTTGSSYGWVKNDELRICTHFVDWMSGLDITLCFDFKQPYIEVKENFKEQSWRAVMTP